MLPLSTTRDYGHKPGSHRTKHLAISALVAVALWSIGGRTAQAQTYQATYTNTANGTTDTAQAVFSLITGTTTYLQVVVSSTSSLAGYHNGDILSGFFFDIAGGTITTLTPVSATTGPLINPQGCSSQTACSATTVDVGDEWVYKYSSSGFSNSTFAGGSSHYGVASSQYGGLTPSFGSGTTTFGSSPPNLAPANGGGQMQFGIVGPNYSNSASAHNVQSLAFINQTLTLKFALNGVTTVGISNVYFTYGTAPDGSSSAKKVPEPASIASLCSGIALLGIFTRRRGRRNLRIQF